MEGKRERMEKRRVFFKGGQRGIEEIGEGVDERREAKERVKRKNEGEREGGREKRRGSG